MTNCQIEQQMIKADEVSFSRLMASKMLENELMGERIFRNNYKRLHSFIALAVSYASKHARVVTCRNDDGEIVAGALVYDRPTDKDISIRTVIKDNWLFSTLRQILSSGIGNVIRLEKMEKLFHEHAIDKPHIYIQMLASGEKGLGGEVLEFIKQQYSDRIIYLESSVSKNDHSYYRNRGFTEFARVTYLDFEQVLFIRPATK